MCGIIGSFQKQREWVVLNVWELKNRGPDVVSIHRLDDVWFGHTRLAIRDISPKGNQPMIKDGVMVTYNGEIWNDDFVTELIQKKYPSYTKPSCDTELLLDFYLWYCRKDITELKHLNGMMAFGLYDSTLQKRILYRDPVGEKPLYYTSDGRFCSKQSCLTESKRMDGFQVRQVIEKGYPMGALFTGVNELQPGIAIVNDVPIQIDDIRYAGSKNLYNRFKHSVSESVHRKITTTDVGFVVCVSGGLDSSLLIAEICSQRPHEKIQCYWYDMHDQLERKHIMYLQRRFNVNIHRLRKQDVPYKAVANVIDVPMELGSVGITYQLAKKIKRQSPGVKVVIMGDGADELFLGYKRHLRYMKTKQYSTSKCHITSHQQFQSLSDIRLHEIRTELQQYHMKRLDQIFGEFGMEVRCPFLYKPLIDIAVSIPTEESIGKQYIRKRLSEHNFPKWFYEQQKKPLKMVEDMDMNRFQLLQYFVQKVKSK